MRVTWPGGHRFAFSVFDDTDWTTLRNGPPVYDLLQDLGVPITKSVWVQDPGEARTTGGGTCGDPEYLDWVTSLQARGHEIGYHNASDRSSVRSQTVGALDRFEHLFGHAPRVGADHGGNREALYAGARRLSGGKAVAYRFAQRVSQPTRPAFSGEDPSSPYFWGDLCRDRIDYWRGFTFAQTNLIGSGPVLYADPARPYVNSWFDSSHGPRREQFLERIRQDRLDHLESEGGVCIMYTHFGVDFVDDHGRPVDDFVAAMTDLRGRDGWFAPVSAILDHLRQRLGVPVLDRRERSRLERRWIADRVRDRSQFGPSVTTHDRSLR